MKKLLELFRLDALQSRLAIDQLLVGHVHRDSHRGLRSALAGPGLKHEEAVALDGELHVLRIAEMFSSCAEIFRNCL